MFLIQVHISKWAQFNCYNIYTISQKKSEVKILLRGWNHRPLEWWLSVHYQLSNEDGRSKREKRWKMKKSKRLSRLQLMLQSLHLICIIVFDFLSRRWNTVEWCWALPNTSQPWIFLCFSTRSFSFLVQYQTHKLARKVNFKSRTWRFLAVERKTQLF